MKLKNLDSFEMESLRNKYSKNKKYKLLRQTYNDAYSEIQNINSQEFWDTKLHLNEMDEIKNPMFADKIHKVVNFLRNKKGKLLSIGLGNGKLEKILNATNNNLDLFGIDISEYAVKNATDNIKGSFKLGSIVNIPYEHASFNYVLVLDVLEHIRPRNTLKAFSEVRRILVKGGIVAISVPLNENLKGMLKKGINPNGHVRTYTPNLLKAELKLAELEPFKEHYLYAFASMYQLKTIIMSIIPIKGKKPNLVLLFAKK